MRTRTLFWIVIIGVVLFFLFGHHRFSTGTPLWNMNIPYPAGVTTNPQDVNPGTDGRPSNESGYPQGTFVGYSAGFYSPPYGE